MIRKLKKCLTYIGKVIFYIHFAAISFVMPFKILFTGVAKAVQKKLYIAIVEITTPK